MSELKLEAIWNLYGTAWSEPNRNKRLEIFARSLNPSCLYRDPQIEALGFDALSACMADFQANLPGAKFVTTSFTSHHRCSLATWDMVGANGAILGKGTSFGHYDEHGLLLQMAGFF